MDKQTQDVLFSSAKVDHETPDDLFQQRHLLYQFELDVCANAENAKLPNYITEAMDTFRTEWTIDQLSPTFEIDEKRNMSNYRVETWKRPARCWMNPPYRRAVRPCKKNKQGEYVCTKKGCEKRGSHSDVYVRGLADFVRLAAINRRKGNLTDCLLPSRTDTKWWFDYVWDKERDLPRPGVLVRFIRGRLKFGNATAGAPFPSVLVTFIP